MAEFLFTLIAISGCDSHCVKSYCKVTVGIKTLEKDINIQ